MKIQDYEFQTTEFSIHHLEELLPEDSLLFDIETTGFQPKYQTVYLIGMGYRKDATIHIRLLYAQSPACEDEILKEFQSFSMKFRRLISFNGDMFDLPFLTKRAEANGLSHEFTNLTSFDLFKEAKKYKSYLNLEHYKQKDLEHYFGIFREDMYNGGQLIDLYKKQETSFNQHEEDLLFLHNMEDVKGMIYLLQIMDFSLLKNATYTLEDYEYHKGEISFCLKSNAISNLSLKIIKDNAFLQVKEDLVFGTISCVEGSLKYYYPDYKNYIYVRDEDLLLPKSLSSTIEKHRIEKAKKEQCFTTKEGIFLLDILNLDQRHFKMDLSDKKEYIEIDPNQLSNHFLLEYIGHLL
ncbi:MAG: ribonuclease H-like domain-containing protein [Lachnospiraceae bacterium]|nr:ribonuclease H-like domain-containing protein [Lachnospiraceae bacterium]